MAVNKIVKILIPFTLFLWGSYCMLKSYGHCEEYVPKYTVEEEVQFLAPSIPHTDEFLFEYPPSKSSWVSPYDHVWDNPQTSKKSNQSKEWQEKYDFHMLHAKRTYEDAKNRVWWLPDVTWRQRGREAWVAAFATVGAQTVQLKLVVALGSFLCQYGLDCLDEWEYIEDKLHWSQYHFEQCAIYAKKLHL